jgi:hypothetical protein
MRLCSSKKINLFLIVFVIALFVFVIFFALTGSKTSAHVEGQQQIKTIIISKGDTLWSIAKSNYTELDGDFDSYIERIKKTNNMECQDLIVGNTLLVPHYVTCS